MINQNCWWGGRAAMRSPADQNYRVADSEYIRVRIPSPPLVS